MSTHTSARIEVVDALRGFAVLSILLLHNIEHFDLYYFPEHFPDWLTTANGIIWDSLFFLFGGKSYAIFALLFGFTFFIQLDNQEKKGFDFRVRFLWRLFVLLLFGILNSIFYQGDILMIYALIGITLLPVAKLDNKVVLIIAVFLLLQPFKWGELFYHFFQHGNAAAPLPSNEYFIKTWEYMTGDSFRELVKGNLSNGRLAAFHWSWENGRFFQAPALFMLGMLLGRLRLFIPSVSSQQFWIKILKISAIIFVPLYFIQRNVSGWMEKEAVGNDLKIIVSSWSNGAFMLVIVSSFFCLFQKEAFRRVQEKLISFGRMSLTNYIVQSILGSFIYYGYGLGLYKYTGAAYCVLIGISLSIAQLFFCRWWLRHHAQGPLEYLWHRATWL